MKPNYVTTLSFLAATLSLKVYAIPSCPLLGPDFPAPRKLSSSKTIQSAISNLTQILDQTIATGSSTYGPFDTNSTSFSLEIFSIHESAPIYSRHNNAGNLVSSASGTKNIGGDTTYRVGSLTKLITVYTYLINAGDITFNDPITKYIPELQAEADALKATENPLDYVAWEDVTIGDLASQMADIGRDYSGFGELEELGVTSPTDGLPPLNSSAAIICAGGAACDRAQFFVGFTQRHPIYAPGTAAIYSNAAFIILSYALENITGQSFPNLVQDSLFTPLNLSAGTSWENPPADNSTAVIPDGSAFSLALGDETP
jgi:hypothetical protein